MQILILVFFVITAIVIGLQILRWSDARDLARTRQELRKTQPALAGEFKPSMIADLPPPARRYFLYTIGPNAPLLTIAHVGMHGEMGLGSKEKPNYLPIRARQILAAPLGFVWQVTAGKGALRLSGSDGACGARSWSRFWMLGTVPVARAGGNPDHARAAFGRLVAEAVFWTPAALLPQPGVRWCEVDQDTARVEVSFQGLLQTVDVAVAEDGQPTSVVFPRWTDANADKEFRIQPFGGYLYDFQWFDGYCLPTRVEAGNFFGTADYFPFFRVQVDSVEFVCSDTVRAV